MSDHHACSDAAFLSSLEGFELIPHVVRALVSGQPVAIDDIADTAGLPVTEVDRFLRSQAGTEWNDDGRLIGFGITSRPTEHRFRVDGKTLYTWCATDTLFFTVILGRPAGVESTCPATGHPVTIKLTPDAVVSVTPDEAVVSQLHHSDLLADVRSQVCDHGHFFASLTAARTWTAEHPNGDVLTVRDAFDHGRAACAELGWIPEVSSR